MQSTKLARRPVATAVLAVSLLAVALVSRLPFRDTTFFISDSVRYALALERYDMTAGRPHPPGNPLYIGIVAGMSRITSDTTLAFALVSALMSGVAFFFAYLLGRDLAGESAGLLAAAILMVSPLFWYFGGLAMPSTGEAALSLVVAWLARRARLPSEHKAYWAMTLALAIGFGFRSTFAVLVSPLWLYASWWHPKRRVAASAIVIASAFFGWTALVAWLSGGWDAYRETSSAFFSEVLIATKILGGGLAKIPRQIRDIAISAVLGLGLFLLPCIAGAYACIKRRGPFPGAAPFMAAWALPAVLFHAAYDWAPRFGVMLLPAAAILAATAAVPMAKRLVEGRHQGVSIEGAAGPMPAALLLLALAVNLGIFLLPVQLGPFTLPEEFPSGPRLIARNDDLARRDATIRQALDPATTVILAYPHTFHAAYFLPDYRVVGFFPVFSRAPDAWVPSAQDRKFSFEPGSTAIPAHDPLPLPANVEHIVLYDDDYLELWPREDLPLDSLPYDVERELKVARVPAPGCLDFDFHRVEFVSSGVPGCGARDRTSR